MSNANEYEAYVIRVGNKYIGSSPMKGYALRDSFDQALIYDNKKIAIKEAENSYGWWVTKGKRMVVTIRVEEVSEEFIEPLDR